MIRKHRSHFAGQPASDLVEECDAAFRELLELSDRNTTRDRYKSHLKVLRANLVRLRSEVAANRAFLPRSLTKRNPRTGPGSSPTQRCRQY